MIISPHCVGVAERRDGRLPAFRPHREHVADVRLAFYTRYIADVPSRRVEWSSAEVLLLNANSGTLPVFCTRRDDEITLACYRHHPVLIGDG